MSHPGDSTHVTGPVRGRGGGTSDGNTGDGGSQKGPTATPYLVITSAAGDVGGRPIPINQAVTNQSITGAVVAGSASGQYQLRLSCVVTNLGVMGCAAGVAEFYMGREFTIDNPGHETLTPAQLKTMSIRVGYVPFQAPPGKSVTIVCKSPWQTGSSVSGKAGVIVQVYDLFTDHMASPFDAVNDRHVGRNDQVTFPLVP